MKFLEETLGISRESKMFIYAVDVFYSVNKDTMKTKFRVFKSYGWTEEDIMTMARNLPNCLKSSETKIKSGLDFFMKKLGYSPGYIASHPKLMMYSLENRVIRRREFWKKLKEKKVIKYSKSSLYSVLGIADQRFLDNYGLPYKNELPKLFETYLNKTLSCSSTKAAM